MLLESEDAAELLHQSLTPAIGRPISEINIPEAETSPSYEYDHASGLVLEWNSGSLKAGTFLRLLTRCMLTDLQHERYRELTALLDSLRGVKRFSSVQHVLDWLSGPRGGPDTFTIEPLDADASETPDDPPLTRHRYLSLSGPVGIASVPGQLDPAVLSELGPFGSSLESALSELRSARLTDLESRFVAFRTVGGLSTAEVATRLGLSAVEGEELWSCVSAKLIRELPEGATAMAADSRIVTFALAETVLLERLLQTPALLNALSWRQFEKALSVTLERIGFEIELQQGTKDGGIDILAIKRAEAFGIHRYLVQAKRYTESVGVSVVRELLFLHSHHRVTKSCLAATSSFTRGAWQLAQQYEWQLELRDRDRLLEWIRLAVQR